MQKMEFCVPHIGQTNKVRCMKHLTLHTACNFRYFSDWLTWGENDDIFARGFDNEEDALKQLTAPCWYAVTNEKKATNYVKW